jgi:hypothetical protein
MKTNVYVDGFNLYYRCLIGTPYKWLDLLTLCSLTFPKNQIHRIRYFTARVQATSDDSGKPQRQNTYIRALMTIPNLTVHYGHFSRHRVRMPLAGPPKQGPKNVWVIKTSEKGSDVNLATYLLADTFENDCEIAVVISNDSDLVAPIKMVQEKTDVKVGILNPQRDKKQIAWELHRAATFYRSIRIGVLKASQFPEALTDANGTFTKPSAW